MQSEVDRMKEGRKLEGRRALLAALSSGLIYRKRPPKKDALARPPGTQVGLSGKASTDRPAGWEGLPFDNKGCP